MPIRVFFFSQKKKKKGKREKERVPKDILKKKMHLGVTLVTNLFCIFSR